MKQTKNIYAPLMFLAAFSLIGKIWKQPKCQKVGEWIKKLWYKYTVEYYDTPSRENALIQFAASCMELEVWH